MATSVPQPGRRTSWLSRRVRQVLIILAVVLIVIAVTFVIVYGVGIRHHHSSANHRAVPTVTRRQTAS